MKKLSIFEAVRISICAAAAVFLCLSICSVPRVAHAQEVFSEGPLYYVVEDGSVTITGYFGRDDAVEVPASIAGMPVNAIAAGAFAGTAARTVVLPDCVTTMEPGAVSQGTNVVWAGESSEDGASGSAGGAGGGSTGASDGAGDAVSAEVGVYEDAVDYDGAPAAGGANAEKSFGKDKAGLLAGISNVGDANGVDAVATAIAAVVAAALAAGIVIVARKLRNKS